MDPDLQQRAIEFISLAGDAELSSYMPTLFQLLPMFPDRASSLATALVKTKDEAADRPVFNVTEVIAGPIENPASPKAPVAELDMAIPPVTLEKHHATPTSPEADDLLGLGATSAPVPARVASPGPRAASPPPASVTSSALSMLDDLLGGTALGKATASAKSAQFLNLCLANSGVLYEDTTIQIGCKMEYQKNNGKITLFYGNRSTAELTNFSFSIGSTPYLSAIDVREAPSSLPAGSQLSQIIMVQCGEAFGTNPQATISFSQAGVVKRLSVDIPVIMTKFFSGATFTGEDFMKRWGAIAGAPLEKQYMGTVTKPLDVAGVRAIIAGLNLTILDGIDPKPANLVCAGVLNAKTPVGALLRVETFLESSKIGLTLKTVSNEVTEHLMALLLQHLALK